MTIHSVNVKTGKKTKRAWTKKELAAHKPRVFTAEEILDRNLRETEGLKTVARKLEEVINYIENGTALSQEAKDWATNRVVIRNG